MEIKSMKKCTFMQGQVTLNFQINEIGPCCTMQSQEIGLTKKIANYNGNYEKLIDDIIESRKRIAMEQLKPENICSTCKYWKDDSSIDDYLFANPIQRLIINNYRTCNLKCVYCPRINLKNPPIYEINPILKSMINRPGFFAPEQTWLTWAGGEPSLYPKDDMLKSVELAKEANMLIRFNTNAVVYSELISETLASYRNSTIICSLDSGTREHYHKIKGKDRFNIVIKNLVKYKKASTIDQIYVKFIDCEENKNTKNDFLALTKHYGFRTIIVKDRQKGHRVNRG